MKRSFLIGSSCVLLLFVGWYFGSLYFYHHWFKTHVIGTVWTENKKQEVSKILSQTFRFCGQGSKSKAYASQDGQYVIKLFIRNRFVSKKFNRIPLLRDYANQRKALKVHYERAFGPMNAYQFIPNETGMLYYQFYKSRNLFPQSFQVIEKDGSISEIDLNHTEFLIQKKAILVSDYLQMHLDNGDYQKVKSGISKLFRMTKMLSDQGIILICLQFLDNFGFIEDEPIRIDVEHICYDPDWKTESKKHLAKQLFDFRSWIVDHAPSEIVEYFDSEVKKIFP